MEHCNALSNINLILFCVSKRICSWKVRLISLPVSWISLSSTLINSLLSSDGNGAFWDSIESVASQMIQWLDWIGCSSNDSVTRLNRLLLKWFSDSIESVASQMIQWLDWIGCFSNDSVARLNRLLLKWFSDPIESVSSQMIQWFESPLADHLLI